MGVLYATDESIEPEWGENGKPCGNRRLNGRRKDVDKWWGEKAPCQYAPEYNISSNILSIPSRNHKGEETFRLAPETLSEEGNSPQPTESIRILSELNGSGTSPREEEQKSFGELPKLVGR